MQNVPTGIDVLAMRLKQMMHVLELEVSSLSMFH